MSGWLVFVAYVVIGILAARRAYWHLRNEGWNDGPIDTFMTGLLAFCAGSLWPIGLPIAAIMWKPRPTARQMEAEREQMVRRIADLERELGIRQ